MSARRSSFLKQAERIAGHNSGPPNQVADIEAGPNAVQASTGPNLAHSEWTQMLSAAASAGEEIAQSTLRQLFAWWNTKAAPILVVLIGWMLIVFSLYPLYKLSHLVGWGWCALLCLVVGFCLSRYPQMMKYFSVYARGSLIWCCGCFFFNLVRYHFWLVLSFFIWPPLLIYLFWTLLKSIVNALVRQTVIFLKRDREFLSVALSLVSDANPTIRFSCLAQHNDRPLFNEIQSGKSSSKQMTEFVLLQAWPRYSTNTKHWTSPVS